ncbi:hypothetical protein Q8G47_28805, partial [Klebsiella pneumoniae]|uniref:hypothetical protein n=1 Tax=Klebsiella pneumoniae TaxID=573 RepID=UPI0030139E72
ELRAELGEIEMDVLTNFTLADAIREGGKVSVENKDGWGNGDSACALHSAVISAKSRDYM